MPSHSAISLSIAAMAMLGVHAAPADAASPAPGAPEKVTMSKSSAPPAANVAARAAIEAAINTYHASLERGDVEAMASVWQDNGTVIDGFAPFIWSGNGALRTWWSAARALLGPAGFDKIRTDVNGWKRFSIQGNRAFVVADATAWLSGPGISLRADGLSSFVLEQGADGAWRIVSWAWAGGEPAPASPH